ncbi:hypothetical protein G6F66_013625 [Rhizopus arrhizus]|nr:hypothetical protein G6F66_013625 [Rhizopus arrhizus]
MVDERIQYGETHAFLGPRFLVTVRHGASLSYAPHRGAAVRAQARTEQDAEGGGAAAGRAGAAAPLPGRSDPRRSEAVRARRTRPRRAHQRWDRHPARNAGHRAEREPVAGDAGAGRDGQAPRCLGRPAGRADADHQLVRHELQPHAGAE